MVSSREGTTEVISGRARESSRQYQDVARKDSLPACPPPQIAAVACARVPATTSLRPLSSANQDKPSMQSRPQRGKEHPHRHATMGTRDL
jgi:hypothetical protein